MPLLLTTPLLPPSAINLLRRTRKIVEVAVAECEGGEHCEKVGILIHPHFIVDGYGPELFVGFALVDMYFKRSNVGYAHKVFNGIPQPDTISELVRNCFFEESLRIFKDMVEDSNLGMGYMNAHKFSVAHQLYKASAPMPCFNLLLPENIRLNFVTSLCRRLNLNELVPNAPVYSSTSGKYIIGRGLSLTFRRWATKKDGGEVSVERNKFWNHVLPMKIKITS
ncbi:hypothetical protein RHSIM_Rhsim01G0083400 [Rhododendron simsii]|uniref:Uncharacterized protein n=1 Tax=Rhododendron simsii TaxID=118357 RepID=A0A834HGZ3_RHOSS|nr:hypothetical protein RHSIM_Rhsim01G0083400 [Rhododendron simsii]